MEVFGYRKLIAYQKAKEVVKSTYRLLKKFPAEERYAMCDQLRSAVFYQDYASPTFHHQPPKLYTIHYTLYTLLGLIVVVVPFSATMMITVLSPPRALRVMVVGQAPVRYISW